MNKNTKARQLSSVLPGPPQSYRCHGHLGNGIGDVWSGTGNWWRVSSSLEVGVGDWGTIVPWWLVVGSVGSQISSCYHQGRFEVVADFGQVRGFWRAFE